MFPSADVEVNPFDEEDAKTAGELRATLEAAGTPIGPCDLMIATQALCVGATSVTTNVGESARISGLQRQDWTAKREATGRRALVDYDPSLPTGAGAMCTI